MARSLDKLIDQFVSRYDPTSRYIVRVGEGEEVSYTNTDGFTRTFAPSTQALEITEIVKYRAENGNAGS